MTPSPLHWPDAALTGLACGMRSFAGPGLLAVRGAVPGRARYGVLALAAGELAADKTPVVPSRTLPPAVAGRVGTGALSGRAVAGLPGAGAGAAAALAGTYASARARSLVVERTGLPDPVVAMGEDILAYALAAVGTRALGRGQAGGDA